MTRLEVNRTLRAKWPSCSARAKRKSKLKSRYAGRLDEEAKRTADRLWLLSELICEARNPPSKGRKYAKG